MARHMADDEHAFRAVVTERLIYADGREPYEGTSIYGPYRTRSACLAQITRVRREAERWDRHSARLIEIGVCPPESRTTRVVIAKIQRAVTSWSDVA